VTFSAPLAAHGRSRYIGDRVADATSKTELSAQRPHLVTFATSAFAGARDRLIASALSTGEFDSAIPWDDIRLRKDPSFRALSLLSHPRGSGYWSWKPHIILQTLKQLPDDAAVLYYDAGRYLGGFTIRRSVAPLIDFADRHGGMMPGVSIPHFGPNARWTRRDCFVLMNCDAPAFWKHPQVQATFSVWLNRPATLTFLEQWRRHCADIRIIGDGPSMCGLPNFPGFVDHRHDQSVLTNLVVKHGLKPFTIDDRIFEWLIALRRNALAAHLFCKKIDNISAVAGGTSPSLLYGRDLLTTKLSQLAPARQSCAVCAHQGT